MTNQRMMEVLGVLHGEEDLFAVDNESRNGRVFATVFYEQARFVPERKCWFVFDGICWHPDTGALRVMELCKQLSACMVAFACELDENGNHYKALKYATLWYKRKFRENVLRDAASVFPASLSEFDAKGHLLNFQNGTLNLKTGEFGGHRALDFLTRCMATEYKEGCFDGRFTAFIDEIMSGDEQKAAFLQKALGYALGGVNSEECLFILYGATTRNGKSTLMESVLGVMGTYGCAANPDTVAMNRQSTGGAPSEDVARLRGARLVNIAEPPQNMVFNAARIKTMTGSDTINARFLHENSFDFKPQFKLYINTNHLPAVNDTTLFESGRIHIIPFERHFEPEEQDTHLKEYFADETVKTAIGMWLTEGYFKYLADGLSAPECVRHATADYAAASDKIGQFVQEKLTPKQGAATPTAEIYRLYRQWCEENGLHPLANCKFSEKLKKYGTTTRKRIDGRYVTVLEDYICTG